MARTKAFDTDQALDRAMHLFWSQGYEHTSMQDLVDVMGVNRGSLYDTYGDKHALYLKAVERYLLHYTLKDVRAAMESPDRDPKAIITSMLERMAREAEDAERGAGCLLTNTIVELGNRGGAVADQVGAAIASMEEMLGLLIAEGQQRGQFRNDRPAADLAVSLVTTMQGLRVRSKVGNSKGRLSAVAAAALETLTGPSA